MVFGFPRVGTGGGLKRAFASGRLVEEKKYYSSATQPPSKRAANFGVLVLDRRDYEQQHEGFFGCGSAAVL
jgi:hypothetical protein